MSTLGINLKKSRLSLNLTQEEVSSKTGIPRGTYAHYELGRREPDNETLLLLANFFNKSPSYLLDFHDSQDNNPLFVQGVKIPVLGRVVAGIPLEAIENIEGYEEITPALASKGEYFALKVKGKSMEPFMLENDIVIVRKQAAIESGDIAIVLVDGCDATIKKVRLQDNGITLIAHNISVYEPHFYTKEEVATLPITIIGKVVEVKRSLE